MPHTILYITKAFGKMTEWKELRGYPHFLISNEGHIKFKGDRDNPEMDWPIWKNGMTTLRDVNNRYKQANVDS